MKLHKLSALCCVFALTISVASAHTLGSSIETIKDGYLIDVGYEPEVVTVGTQTRFDFALYDNDTKEMLSFDNIWFRIEKDNKVYLAGGLSRQSFGLTGITYRFQEAGQYELYVRYASSSESITDTTVTFDVLPAPDDRSAAEKAGQHAVPVTAGFIIGLSIMWFISKKRSS